MRRSTSWVLASILILIHVTQAAAVRHIVFGLERRIRHRVEVGGVVVLENAPIPPAGDLAFDGPVVSPTRILDSGGTSSAVGPGQPGGPAASEASWLRVGPNPSHGALHFALRAPGEGIVRVALHDAVSGRRRFDSDLRVHEGANHHPLALPAGIAPGLYLLRVSAPWGAESRKIVLLRRAGSAGDPSIDRPMRMP